MKLMGIFVVGWSCSKMDRQWSLVFSGIEKFRRPRLTFSRVSISHWTHVIIVYPILILQNDYRQNLHVKFSMKTQFKGLIKEEMMYNTSNFWSGNFVLQYISWLLLYSKRNLRPSNFCSHVCQTIEFGPLIWSAQVAQKFLVEFLSAHWWDFSTLVDYSCNPRRFLQH